MEHQDQQAPRHTYTIPQFCAAYNLSRPYFYKLQAMGKGPRILKMGRKVLISAKAAEEWLERLERESEEQTTNTAA